jgi:hypothetical protein
MPYRQIWSRGADGSRSEADFSPALHEISTRASRPLPDHDGLGPQRERRSAAARLFESVATARSAQSARGNNRAAALSRGAAPVQVNSPVAGMVLPPEWSDHIAIELSARSSKIDWAECSLRPSTALVIARLRTLESVLYFGRSADQLHSCRRCRPPLPSVRVASSSKRLAPAFPYLLHTEINLVAKSL